MLVNVYRALRPLRKSGLMSSLLRSTRVGPIMVVLASTPVLKSSLVSSEEPRLPTRYDAQLIKAYWDRRPLEVAKRTWTIIKHFLPFLTKLLVWECLIRRQILHHEGLQRKYAIKLREILTHLGPCFIKLGQALSIRPDLLPSSVLFELQKLCDAVPSFPTSQALQVMDEELGGRHAVQRIFSDLKETTSPVAAASLGQVYKLKLRENGAPVAVKVQRPDMHSFVLLDLYIMRYIAKVAETLKSYVTKQRPYDVALLDSFASASLLELDYMNEAANQQRFKDDLAIKMGNRVYVPIVYHQYTTRKVLVTEWVEGVQLAKSPSALINSLTPIGVECFLVQLLETGYFHADPHPGNLLVKPNGQLVLIDFGLCAEVPLPDTKTMTKAIVHLMQGDVAGLIDDAIQLGFLPTDVNVDKLRPELQDIFDSAQLVLEEDILNASYQAVTRRRKRFMAVSYDLNKVFFTYPFLVPDYFALITRAMIVLEGIAVTGDPSFDLFNSAYPYAMRRALKLFGYSNLSTLVKEAHMFTHAQEQKRLDQQTSLTSSDETTTFTL